MMSSDNQEVVTWYQNDDVGVIEINNPPVNALSQAVRAGILAGLEALNQSDCETILLHCHGKTFCAGADIREFNQPPKEPHLPDVVLTLNNNPKPVIAILHGTVLGGGLEIALACQGRIAYETCRIGLPEVNLGLIPGAGGTQLLPNYLGTEKAIEMITSGKHFPITTFRESGLIDKYVEKFDIFSTEKLLSNCFNYSSHLSDTSRNNRSSKMVGWAAIEAAVTKNARGRIAPIKALEVIKATEGMSLEDGMSIERKAFLELKSSEQSAALRHAFAAEKKAVKYESSASPIAVSKIGIVGGGTMGCGIATTCLNAGYQVTVIEQSKDAAINASKNIKSNLQKALQRGLIDQLMFDKQSGNLSYDSDKSALSEVDIVIEAIFEDLDLKIELFKTLQGICRSDCIFATNTSYLDINQMGQALDNPERLIGLHFFSPAHIMKLVEVVKTESASMSAIATGFQVAKTARKLPVLVGNCFGFAANRMYSRYGREIQQMLLEGATVSSIDSAMKEFGMAMGPLAVQDLAGIDVGHRARSSKPFPEHDPGYFKVSAHLVEQGNYGRKTGMGFYQYKDSNQVVNPALDAEIKQLADSLNISRTYPDKEQIQHRALMALISEGYQILQEGIISRISDLDVIWLNGYGFPRYRGGPMFIAERLGNERVMAELAKLREQYGERIWPNLTL